MSINYNEDERSALEAISEAQRIAFSPFIFQATVAMRDLGLLADIEMAGDIGINAEALADKANLSVYGVKVLLDAGLSFGLVWKNEENYCLGKVGHYILNDKMTIANLEFTRDLCYRGLDSLKDSIREGKPSGLKEFGGGDTIYPKLSALPEPAKSSWFNFDHYYSDIAFPDVLPLVFKYNPKHLLDVGGNTGKWAMQCVKYNEDINVTVVDLPQQLALMRENIVQHGLSDRIDGYAIDWLSDDGDLPTNADAVWMSQFLDCFSEAQIKKILGRIVKAMKPGARLHIMETFWDRQEFEVAAFSLNCISLYFTCFANGNSRMYHSDDMKKLIIESGFEIEREVDGIGISHTLLTCKLSK